MCYGIYTMTPEEIKKLRADLGLTKVALALLFSIDYHTVRRWELGKQKPHQVHLAKLHQLRDSLEKAT